MANPIMNPRTYAQITGIALAAVAVLGIVLSAMGTDGKYGLFCSADNDLTPPTKDATTCKGDAADSSFLAFDWTHNILHVVLAAVALGIGFATVPGNYIKLYAQVFGVVYLGLGITGFFVMDLGILHLELGENLVHLVIGLWGAVAGFFGTTVTKTRSTGVPTTTRRT